MRMTYSEFRVAEELADEKHDFVDGSARLRTVNGPEHGRLAAAVAGELGAAVSGKRCRLFSSDARVRVQESDASFYPDVSMVCGTLATDPEDPNAIANPLVLVEVLSDSTEAYDRGAKAGHYRRLPSLREYVLVSQNECRIEVQRLNEKGTWELHFYGPGEQVELTSAGVRFSVDAVYANPLG